MELGAVGASSTGPPAKAGAPPGLLADPVLASQQRAPTASDDPMGSPARAGPPAGPPTGISPPPTASDDPMRSPAKAGASEGPPAGVVAPITPFLRRDEAPVLRRPERRVATAVDDVEVIEEDEPEGIRAGLRVASFPPTDDVHSRVCCMLCECVGCLKNLGTCPGCKALYSVVDVSDPIAELIQSAGSDANR